MYSAKGDLIGLIEARADSGRRAYQYVDSLFTQIIATLRRHPRFKNIGSFELEIVLADVRSEAEKTLLAEVRDHVHVDDAVDAVHQCLGGEDD